MTSVAPGNVFYLCELPSEALLLILFKLNNTQLCRMRQTCSYLDEFVEERRKKLARRRIFSTSEEGCCNMRIKDGCVRRQNFHDGWFYSFKFPSDKERKLSACSFNTINVDYSFETDKETMELLRRQKFCCYQLIIGGAPFEKIVEIASLIQFEEMHIFVTDAEIDGIKALSSLLEKVDNRKDLSLNIDNRTNWNSKGLWKLMSQFGSVSFGTITKEDCISFLWTSLYQGNLRLA